MSPHKAKSRASCVRFVPLYLLLASQSCLAAPVVTNPGFESNLSGWTNSGVAIESTKVHAGSKSLSLRGGSVQQMVTGLQAGAVHTLSLAYRDNTAQSWILSHARVLIDGQVIGEIHNGQDFEYLNAAGFEFTPGASSAVLRIESLTAGPEGLLVDSIAITEGGLPAPPAHAWASLAAINDGRGGRRLANGSFEDATSDPASDPDNYGPAGNPHLAKNSLPGWRVTRENVDIIEGHGANPPHGSKALDTGGHGPGGIAQTITGLQAGAAYTFSFLHARHIYWGEAEMTGEVYANGRRVASLTRNMQQTWEQGYGLKEIPLLASAQGTLTIEIRSTTTDQGGNIIYDDVRLKEGGNGFQAWCLHHGLPEDPDANGDGDLLPNGLEFLLGSNPAARETLPASSVEGSERLIKVPISGLARSAGYTHRLRCSKDLQDWRDAGESGSGVTLISDSSAPGTDGTATYRIDPGERQMFWTHHFTAP